MKFIIFVSFFIFIFTIGSSLSVTRSEGSKEDLKAALTGDFDDGNFFINVEMLQFNFKYDIDLMRACNGTNNGNTKSQRFKNRNGGTRNYQNRQKQNQEQPINPDAY